MSEDETVALLAEALDPSTPSPDVRTRLLDALQGPERFTLYADEVARVFTLKLDDAREALRGIAGEGWQPGMWPGSRWLRTPALTAARALIADMPAGLRIPHHKHPGRELTFILDGELVEDGRVYRSGELVDKEAGSAHALQVTGSRCLVVFALPA
ncbi:MAG: cupin domain-containing protein [Polyangiales bacterium]